MSAQKYNRVIAKLINAAVANKTFIFSEPKELSAFILKKEMSWVDWDEIKSYWERCRDELDSSQKIVSRKFSVSDRAATVLECAPLPGPEVIVQLKEKIIRFETTVFLYAKGILLSLKQSALSESGVGYSGINLSKKERKLVQMVRDMVGRSVLKHPVFINKSVNVVKNIDANIQNRYRLDEGIISEAIDAISTPVLFGILNCVLASLMPLLEESAKPFFFPAIRLSEDENVSLLQYTELRNVLGGFTYGRDPSISSVRIPEIAIQDEASYTTLKKVVGLPVIARVDKDAIQRKLTDEIQRANYEIIATGFAKHPFKTIPLLVGNTLPADNVILAVDWPTFESSTPEHIAIIKAAMEYAVWEPDECLAAKINRLILNLNLNGRRYADAYLLALAKALDEELFTPSFGASPPDHLTRKVQAMLMVIQDQRAEQLQRFERATAILMDVRKMPDIVAPSAKEMEPHHLGFLYPDSNGSPRVAFELKTDFPQLISRRLSLLDSDSLAFRQYLLNRGVLKEVSTNARGRDGRSCSHVLIPIKPPVH